MAIAPGAAVTPEEISITSGVATTTTGSATTQASGSSFIIALRAYGDNYSAVTDTFSNTYTLQRKIQNTSDGDWLHIYLCANGTGGASHKPKITITASQIISVGLHEILGGAAAVVDVVSAGLFDQASPFGDSVTSTNSTDMIVGYFGSNGATTTVTYTPGAGFTTFPSAGSNIGTNGLSYGVAYDVVSATGTYNPAFTVSAGGRGPAITLALKAAGGANTLTAANGSFSLSGQAAVLNTALIAAFGSFSLAGQAAALVFAGGNQTLLAAPGAFNFVGASSQSNSSILATAVIYVLTGQNANLSGPALSGSKGSFLLLGVGN